MNTQTNSQTQNNIEIDLERAIKKFFIQWRAWLIFSIVFAVLVSGLKYAKDMKAYSGSQDKQAVTSDDLIKNGTLTDDQLASVQQAVTQKKLLDNLSDYMSESIYMNLDPANSRQLSLLYYIRAAHGTDAEDVMTLYSDMLTSDDSVTKIASAAEIDTDPKYIRELIRVNNGRQTGDDMISTSDSSTGMMKIVFILPPDSQSDAVEKEIENLVSDYSVTDGDLGGSTLHEVSTEVRTVNNTDMSTAQQNASASLYNMNSQYSATTGAFSDEQKTLFDTVEKENSSESNTAEKQTMIRPSVSGKYALFGFIIGIILFIIIDLIYDVCGSRYSLIAGTDRASVAGSIYDGKSAGKNILMYDSHLMKILFRECTDIKASTEKILARMQMNSGTDSLEYLELWTVGFDGTADKAIEQFMSEADKKDIKIKLRQTVDGSPYDMIDETEQSKSVAIAVRSGVSARHDAVVLQEMLAARKCDYLGRIELM